jgi:hypothetical protein
MRQFSRFVVLAAAVLLCRGASAQELLDLNKPITLDIVGHLPFVTSLQTRGGWPLTIRMLANKPIGIGTSGNGLIPPLGDKAWIVWADPDNNFSFACTPNPFVQCPPTDETYLEFTPGLTSQGTTGEQGQQIFHYDWATHGNTKSAFIGPHTGGYGRSSSIPGLVILSDTGVGREFIPDAARGIAQTGRARNLAGFVDSVAWDMNDRMPFLARTSVTAQMNVPNGLFTPITFVDYGACPLPGGYQRICPIWKWTIDGSFGTGPFFPDMQAATEEKVTTVRIFVVDGPAPDLVANENGDNVIDSRDVTRMTNPVTGKPYKLLSGERVIRFQIFLRQAAAGIPFDLDGDGIAEFPLPAGGGGIVKIPK